MNQESIYLWSTVLDVLVRSALVYILILFLVKNLQELKPLIKEWGDLIQKWNNFNNMP